VKSSHQLLSIIESPAHSNYSRLYQRLNIKEERVGSIRKAIGQVKKCQPDFIVAEFFYGYGNNYAGVNISNLDVLLSTLQKYAHEARVIVMVDQSERQYVDKLNELFPLHAVLVHPVSEQQLESCLNSADG
jgi:AmiR/NasT family two-component response regulator